MAVKASMAVYALDHVKKTVGVGTFSTIVTIVKIGVLDGNKPCRLSIGSGNNISRMYKK
jgi:hypothetical protein